MLIGHKNGCFLNYLPPILPQFSCVRSSGQIITDLFSLDRLNSPTPCRHSIPHPGRHIVEDDAETDGGSTFPSWSPRELSPQASPGLTTTLGQLVLTRLLVLETMGNIISWIFQSLRGKSNFNPVMCLDSGSLLQISTHDEGVHCPPPSSPSPWSRRSQNIYFHIFEAPGLIVTWTVRTNISGK